MVAIAHTMEEDYGQYFDSVIPFEVPQYLDHFHLNHESNMFQDVEFVMKQLMYEISLLEREPQWVPAKWVKVRKLIFYHQRLLFMLIGCLSWL